MAGVTLLIFSVFTVYVIQLFVGFWNIRRATGNHRGRRTFLGPLSLLGCKIPKWKSFNFGQNYASIEKYDGFSKCGYDLEATIALWPRPSVNVFVADPRVVKEITNSRGRFPKPVELYTSLNFFGPNILVSEGPQWRKYRKLCAPAFSELNNKMVWVETMNVMDSLFDEVWGDRDEIVIDHGSDLTLQFALLIIGSAAFGTPISWKDDQSFPSGHKMSFKHTLHIATTDFVPKMVLPEWIMGLRASWRECRDGFDELRLYMKEMIRDRLASDMSDRHDLFTSLLQANGNGLSETDLDDDEIIGHVYIFLIAGHETSAHSLCFTMGLLALYQEEQDQLYEHIKSVTKDRAPTYADMPQFTRVLATLYETLRMYPPVTVVPKVTSEDVTLSTTNAAGDSIAIPVPKGTDISLHVGGLHYNPRYWEDPHEFKPDRFLKDWPRDAFLPFSGGARACLGRKFSETESVGFLVRMISNYKISIKEEPQFSGETFAQKKERVMTTVQRILVAPRRIPLVFTRRK